MELLRDISKITKSRTEDEAAAGADAMVSPEAGAVLPGSDIFRELFEASRDAIGVSLGGAHVYVNHAYVAMYGFEDRDELIGTPVFERVVPEQRESLRRRADRRARGLNEPSSYDLKGLRSDGSVFDLENRVSTYKHGSQVYTLSIQRDVTRQKHVERALRENKDRLSHALRAAHMGIWEWDLRADKVIWTGEHEQLFGLEPGTFGGTYDAFLECVHPEDRHRIYTRLMSAIDDGSEFNEEFRALWPDGQVRWIVARGTVVMGQDGRALKQTGVCFDVSDRKYAQLALEQQTQRNTAVLDGISDAFMTIDHGLRFTFINRKAEQLLGRTRGELLGKRIADLAPGQLAGAIQRQMSIAIDEQGPVACEQPLEDVGIVVDLRIHPTVEGVSVFVHDVTQEHKSKIDRQLDEQRRRRFVRDVLASVTEKRLQLCENERDLPEMLRPISSRIELSRSGGLSELRRLAHDTALSMGFSSTVCTDLEIATGEAGMNAIVHAGIGTGRICSNGTDTVQVWIEDQGAGIAFENLPQATLQRGYSSQGTMGHGFKIMLQTSNRVWLLTGANGTTVVLEQHPTAESEFKF